MRFCDLQIGEEFTEVDGDEQSHFVKINPVITLTDGTILKTVVKGQGITMEPVAAQAVVANVLNLKNMTLGVLLDDTLVIRKGKL
jgi:hypothetical protein